MRRLSLNALAFIITTTQKRRHTRVFFFVCLSTHEAMGFCQDHSRTPGIWTGFDGPDRPDRPDRPLKGFEWLALLAKPLVFGLGRDPVKYLVWLSLLGLLNPSGIWAGA